MEIFSTKYHFDSEYKATDYEEVVLYQIGEMCSNSFNTIGEHYQPCFEFTVVSDGRGVSQTNGVKTEIKTGDIYLSITKDKHKIISDDVDPLRFYFFAFTIKENSFLQKIANYFEEKHKDPFLRTAHNRFNVDSLITKILTEIIKPSEYSHELVSYYIKEIILLTYRSFTNFYQQNYEPNISSQHSLAYNIKNHIDSNLLQIENITNLSNEFNYSYSYISKAFKNIVGISIHEYFYDKKMKLAATYLTTKNLSITEIVEKLNFSSIHIFSRAFKNKYNMSPSDYAKLNKQ